MVNGVEKVEGGRIIPALRYRNGQAAIDWLCKSFGFEKKMVVPGDGGRITHAELVLGNGIIMLGDMETEYGGFVRAPRPPERVNTQGSTPWSPMSTAITPALGRPGPRSSSISRRKVMAGATTPAATSKVMSGPSAPMTPG